MPGFTLDVNVLFPKSHADTSISAAAPESMKSVCCSNMPFAKEAFSTLGDVLLKDGRTLTPADVRDADLLAIRSTTRVDRSLLDGSRVQFVGTATIGYEHMDTRYLEQAGIRWCHSPGCNANSVSEYVTAALLCLACRHGLSLQGKTIGVIGVGNVGTQVVKKGRALGMRVLQNDPPRQRTEDGRPNREDRDHTTFVSLDRVLAESDVVTLHVPLTKEGLDATYHLANRTFFEKMKPGCLFINSARGAVTVTDALLEAMHRGTVSHAIVDTWEGEPNYRQDLLERVDIGTPHIAGHSFEGKVMGTVMVYREACRFLGVEAAWSEGPLMPPALVPEIRLDAAGLRDEEALWRIVRPVYDIEADDRRLRDRGGREAAEHFDWLRRTYPVRREFRFTRVRMMNGSEELERKLRELGFGTR
jgi:erythronate-4-phosphate dehydrogenase